MINDKRSVELSINIIIIAVIALIALVVVIAIFTGKTRIFASTLEDCNAKQGYCTTRYSSQDICPPGEAFVPNARCDGGVCCVRVLGEDTDRGYYDNRRQI